ncbi:MAG: carboxypeptidase-like regulatory domain-containing protein [Bacteroidetes bacterium]|nr:carboxypeptidase-like regulatory domain-containing protein [Bacteroidota bacterium]
MNISRKVSLSTIYFFTAIFFCLVASAQVSEKTIITGKTIDELTGDVLPFVSVILRGTTVGTVSDAAGKYRIETNVKASEIVFSFIGYETLIKPITPGRQQTVNVSLKLSSINLDEVIVTYEKKSYKNKGNPAVELIQNVIDNKEKNRPESYDYLTYRKYEKIQFAFSNIDENLRQSGILKKFDFVFDNVDTTKRVGNSILPVYIKETLSEHYYRNNPESSKEVVLAEKTLDLERYINNRGAGNYLNYLYQNINIYDNEILFLTNKFLSPIAGTAPAFYKYYIDDTLSVNDIQCVRMFFAPRNKADFLFHGYLYITLDSSYAVRKTDMGINKDINIDWVQNMSIVQDFEKGTDNKWVLSKDEISIDFGIVKNTTGLYGQRTISYRDYSTVEPVNDLVFSGPDKTFRIDSASLKREYWEENRLVPLTKSERQIYSTVDSLNNMKEFKVGMDIITMLISGFLNLGYIELGTVTSFYSYNEVEGSRIRFGGRTSTDFSKKITLDGYGAYGTTDKTFKYNAGITYSLTPRTIYQFPVRYIRVNYQKDVRIPSQDIQNWQVDNVLLSFKRGINDKLFMNNQFKVEYLHEFENHFSYQTGYLFNRQYSHGNLNYYNSSSVTVPEEISHINISELFLNLRYAPNESFYQGKMYRTTFPNRNPIINLRLTGGSTMLKNDFDYLRLQLNISRRYYFSILGYTDIALEAGKTFGQAPYPLLFLHPANQTYSFQKYSYNLMNFLEFVSDQYASINIDHSFNGFILNKVPLIKQLKLRELITFKALYGSLSDRNDPLLQPGLFSFPLDESGTPLTYTLGNKPYIEAGIGLSNIFRIFRVDFIQRLTYTGNPNVNRTGFRVQFRLDI